MIGRHWQTVARILKDELVFGLQDTGYCVLVISNQPFCNDNLLFNSLKKFSSVE